MSTCISCKMDDLHLFDGPVMITMKFNSEHITCSQKKSCHINTYLFNAHSFLKRTNPCMFAFDTFKLDLL